MKQHLKQTALTVLFSSAVLSSLAAPIHIKGLVRDADNSPLPGASITLINDSKTGTSPTLTDSSHSKQNRAANWS